MSGRTHEDNLRLVDAIRAALIEADRLEIMGGPRRRARADDRRLHARLWAQRLADVLIDSEPPDDDVGVEPGVIDGEPPRPDDDAGTL